MKNRGWVAGGTVLLLVLAGCGGSEDSKKAATTRPSATTPSTPTTSAAATSTTASTSVSTTTTEPTTTTSAPEPNTSVPTSTEVLLGAEVAQRDGFETLTGKRVAVLANRASMSRGPTGGPVHIIDALAADPDIELVSILAPEHGLRGDLGAGVEVDSEVDPVTGLPVHSLYGDTKAPTPEMLSSVDVVVIDLQDVGARYYTYISTLGLTMQAAAASGIAVQVLDRPNPQGLNEPVGFVRADGLESFVGQYPIPSLYAMTIGELATAIAGEGWLSGLEGLDLTVVEMEGFHHDQRWDETGLNWVPPSPGLQTVTAAMLYPALIGFEPSNFSYGSGTADPFTAIAAPWAEAESLTAAINALGIPGMAAEPYSFTPEALPGMNQDPRFEGEEVHGAKLSISDPNAFSAYPAGLALLQAMNQQAQLHGQTLIDDEEMFDLLAGTTRVREWLDTAGDLAAISTQAQSEAQAFAPTRAKYLRYP